MLRSALTLTGQHKVFSFFGMELTSTRKYVDYMLGTYSCMGKNIHLVDVL